MPESATEKPLATKTVSRKRDDAELVQQTFRVALDTLPASLAEAITTLSHLAFEMRPDDISLALDLPAGTLMFRAYKRAAAITD